MAITKRTRYEVLKRDNHACRYCGAIAPDVKLQVDHVIPVALGGTDNPDNLVAACVACNSGKSSVPAGADVAADVKQRALQFKRDYDAALQAQVIKIRASKQYRGWFAAHWSDRVGDRVVIGWESTLDHWHSLDVPWEVVENAIDIAASKTTLRNMEAVYKYMCGIVWNVIKAAAEEYAEPMPSVEDRPRTCDECEQEVDGLLDEWSDEGDVTWRCFDCIRSEASIDGYQKGHDHGYEYASDRFVEDLDKYGGHIKPFDLIALYIDGRTSPLRDRMEWRAA